LDHNVDVLSGVYRLDGEDELDFTLDAPLPLAWQRTYTSSNANTGWFGQGWSVPVADRLDITNGKVDYIDKKGSRTPFEDLKVGGETYSQYRHITLKRTARNEYEILIEDGGLRLLFGLLPRDEKRLRDTGELETGLEPASRQAPAQAGTLALVAQVDRNGNSLKIRYDEHNIPTRIDASTGRSLALAFERQPRRKPRLTSVRELPRGDGAGRLLVQYRYNPEGDLAEVLDGEGRLCRRYRWDRHMLVGHGSPGGVSSRIEYTRLDPNGFVASEAVSTGQSWRFAYDLEDRYMRVIDSEGRVFDTWADNDRRRPLVVKDPLGHTWRTEYDQWGGNPTQEIDPLGRITERKFDKRSRPALIALPDGSCWAIQWHETSELPLCVTDPLGNVTRYEYDERGNLICEIDANRNETLYELDARGLVTRITDARGGIQHLEYDPDGRVVSHTDCSDVTTRYRYDQGGNLASVTDGEDNVTSYAWEWVNRQARLSAVHHPDGSTERFAYDPLGRLIAYHDPLGHATCWRVNEEGDPIERTDALEHSLKYAYDRHGRLTTLINENGAHYHFQWDKADRLTREQSFDGREQHYTYNGAAEVILSRDGAEDSGILTRYRRDPLGRLLLKTAIRQKTEIDSHQVRRTRFSWDKAGQLTLARNRHATVSFGYTPTGEIETETTIPQGGKRSELTHRYSPLGHRIATTLPDGRTINHLTYGNGHVHQINIDGEIVSDIERDELHREVKRTQGKLESIYTLDAMGRLLASRASRRDGTESNTTTGQKIARRYTYDQGGRLTQIEDAIGGITRYGYDALGRLLEAVTPNNTERFKFDPAHNLIDPASGHGEKAGKEWTDEEWAEYVRAHLDDPGFSPLKKPKTLPSLSNRLTVYGEHRYQYDAWGNCTQKKSGKHVTRDFKWDVDHRLTDATITNTTAGTTEHWQYIYDPLGRRIGKRKVDGQGNVQDATRFYWDGNRLLAEDRNNRRQLYLYEPESFVPLALVRSEATDTAPERKPTALPANLPENVVADLARIRERMRVAKGEKEPEPLKGETFYIHTDQIGTPKEVTNTDGCLVWRAEYLAWGGVREIERPDVPVTVADGNTARVVWEGQADPVECNIRFQGQYCDDETGLHYNRFRYYDSDVGRFVSQDPIGLLGGECLYQYADNPISWIDPLGLTTGSLSGIPKIGEVFGASVNAGGGGSVHPLIRDLYGDIDFEDRSRWHKRHSAKTDGKSSSCAEASALSDLAYKIEQEKGIPEGMLTEDILKKYTEGATWRSYDFFGEVMPPCPGSCSTVLNRLGIIF